MSPDTEKLLERLEWALAAACARPKCGRIYGPRGIACDHCNAKQKERRPEQEGR